MFPGSMFARIARSSGILAKFASEISLGSASFLRMADGQNLSTWVTGARRERALEVARERFGGNVSEMMKTALDAFLVRTITSGDARSPTIMVDLARRLMGELDAEEMAAQVEGENQPRVLRDLLQQFLAAGMASEEAREWRVAEDTVGPPAPPTTVETGFGRAEREKRERQMRARAAARGGKAKKRHPNEHGTRPDLQDRGGLAC